MYFKEKATDIDIISLIENNIPEQKNIESIKIFSINAQTGLENG